MINNMKILIVGEECFIEDYILSKIDNIKKIRWS